MVTPSMASVNDSSSCNDDHSSSSSFSTNTNHLSSSSSIKMFKGVRKRKWGKWVSEIRLPNSRERIWLGSYDTQEKAARAFDAALYCLRGKSATFNFPDTPNNLQEVISEVLPHHNSLSPQEIQEVAAKFANKESGSQLEEPQQSEQEYNKSNNTRESTTITTTTFDDSNNNIYDDGSMVVDQGEWDTADWIFLNMLDDLNNSNDFGLYFGPDKMHPGEFLCSTQAPLLFGGGEIDEVVDHDAFSNHSFLWNWNF